MGEARLPARTMARIALLFLFIFSGVLFSASSVCTQAVNKWSKAYDVDSRLVWAIILNESRGRWWVHSDDKDVLITRGWCLSIVRQFGLDPANSKIWWSVGVMQVNYLVALDLGYRGGPEMLRDSRTNVKYGIKRLWQIRRHHELSNQSLSLWNWIYHYNQSSLYVNDVLATYRRLQCRSK